MQTSCGLQYRVPEHESHAQCRASHTGCSFGLKSLVSILDILNLIAHAVRAAMAAIISVSRSKQSAPWDDPAQAVGIVRSGLRDEKYIVLNIDQDVSLAAQV